MSNPVFYMIGVYCHSHGFCRPLLHSFSRHRWGILFAVAAAVLIALLVWIIWIRWEYAFGGGGMMEKVHQTILDHLDYRQGAGTLLDVGCGAGALSIRAALTWRRENRRHRLLGCGVPLQQGPL